MTLLENRPGGRGRLFSAGQYTRQRRLRNWQLRTNEKPLRHHWGTIAKGMTSQHGLHRLCMEGPFFIKRRVFPKALPGRGLPAVLPGASGAHTGPTSLSTTVSAGVCHGVRLLLDSPHRLRALQFRTSGPAGQGGSGYAGMRSSGRRGLFCVKGRE